MTVVGGVRSGDAGTPRRVWLAGGVLTAVAVAAVGVDIGSAAEPLLSCGYCCCV